METEVPIKLSPKERGKYRPVLKYVPVNLTLKWKIYTDIPPALSMPPTLLNSFLKLLKYYL